MGRNRVREGGEIERDVWEGIGSEKEGEGEIERKIDVDENRDIPR